MTPLRYLAAACQTDLPNPRNRDGISRQVNHMLAMIERVVVGYAPFAPVRLVLDEDDRERRGEQVERADLFHQIQTILQQDVPHAFLYHTVDTTGFSNDVQGYNAIPEMRFLETVWLDR